MYNGPIRHASHAVSQRHAFLVLLRERSLCGDWDGCIRLHAEISRMDSLQGDVYLGSILVDMYAKCGLLANAQDVFSSLRYRDVVVWTALISGYAEHGYPEKAFDYFARMQQFGIPPDAFTLVCILKACSYTGAIEKAEAIYCEIIKKGLLESNVFLGSILVDMYVKFGVQDTARGVLDKLWKHDVVTWNALLSGYSQHGCCEETFNCLHEMHNEGIAPNIITLVLILKSCGISECLVKGQQVHMDIIRKGMENDVLISSTLVGMYAKCAMLPEARLLFDTVQVRDVVFWNIMIMGYTDQEYGEEALITFEQMQEVMNPDIVTYLCILKACCIVSATCKGQEIHADIIKKGFDKDSLAGTALVNLYIKFGLFAEVQEVLSNLPAQDSCTSVISGYVDIGQSEVALDHFEQAHESGISSSTISLISSLKACGNVGSAQKGWGLHVDILKKGFEKDAVISNSLVHMYTKCGLLVEARKLFDNLPVKDIFSWNALLIGYAHVGESENVFCILDKMIGESVNPCPVTLLSLLNACNHAGLVDKCLMYFHIIRTHYEFDITLDHYACIVDLFARAGYIEVAVCLISNMPFQPDVATWHAVLAACCRGLNVEVAIKTFEHATQLDEEDISTYLCMINNFPDAVESGKAQKKEAREL